MNNARYKKQKGILGGTFNPVHSLHISIALQAMEFCGLDEVVFMPSGCSYLKDPKIIAPAYHRINMTKIATEKYDGLFVSTLETDRPGNTYTYETLMTLCETEPETHFYYITGADTMMFMDKWMKPEEVFKRCTVVCAKRTGVEDSALEEKAQILKNLFSADIILMDGKAEDVSSTMIRKMIASGDPCTGIVDEDVMEYIRENGLYGNDSHQRKI